MALAALAPLLPVAKSLALQGVSAALPTVGKLLGSNLFSLGKPSVEKFLKTMAEQAQTPEGREKILNLAIKGTNVGHKIATEGLGLAQQLGLSQRKANELLDKLGSGKRNFHALLGTLNKVNKRVVL